MDCTASCGLCTGSAWHNTLETLQPSNCPTDSLTLLYPQQSILSKPNPLLTLKPQTGCTQGEALTRLRWDRCELHCGVHSSGWPQLQQQQQQQQQGVHIRTRCQWYRTQQGAAPETHSPQRALGWRDELRECAITLAASGKRDLSSALHSSVRQSGALLACNTCRPVKLLASAVH
jgi:hypothetical protein